MKVLLTATVQSHIVQFHKPLVEVLHAHGYEVHVAARDNLAEKNALKVKSSVLKAIRGYWYDIIERRMI